MDSHLQLREIGNPYKIVDHTREHKKGITARSLEELINIARTRFSIPLDATLRVVLEQDGTEIDDEEYFATIEKNTNLMILYGNQKWVAQESEKSAPHFIVVDETDNNSQSWNFDFGKHLKKSHTKVGSLVNSLQNESSQISLLSGTDLEMLSDMDPDSVADMIPDRLFIEQIKQASGRFLADKRQVHESMSLLHLFSTKSEIEQT